MTHLKNWQTKFATTRPRRLLALDGGGIRGVMTLEILRKIEQDLATATGKGASFRLGDFFDYIGGTSTGAIIAAGLAMGKSVQELSRFLHRGGTADVRKIIPDRPAAQLLSGRSAAQETEQTCSGSARLGPTTCVRCC